MPTIACSANSRAECTNGGVTGLISERAGSTSKVYHGDQLGNTRGMSNGSEAITDSREYDAWGLTIASSGSGSPFGFVGGQGYQKDPDSGLMLLGARYYDPSVGRFISRDPIGYQGGLNLYGYCANNPVSRTDGSGCDWLDNAANFFAGWGDRLTHGGTEAIRIGIGANDGIDHGSGWYAGGGVVGAIHGTLLARGIGKAATFVNRGGQIAEAADQLPELLYGDGGPYTAIGTFDSLPKWAEFTNVDTCIKSPIPEPYTLEKNFDWLQDRVDSGHRILVSDPPEFLLGDKIDGGRGFHTIQEIGWLDDRGIIKCWDY